MITTSRRKGRMIGNGMLLSEVMELMNTALQFSDAETRFVVRQTEINISSDDFYKYYRLTNVSILNGNVVFKMEPEF